MDHSWVQVPVATQKRSPAKAQCLNFDVGDLCLELRYPRLRNGGKAPLVFMGAIQQDPHGSPKLTVPHPTRQKLAIRCNFIRRMRAWAVSNN